MSILQASYRGRVQAQGEDIQQEGGYSYPWARDKPVTDRDGLSFIAKIEEKCSESQKTLRDIPFRKARRFVKQASAQGGVGPEAQPHPFQDPKRDKRKYNGVRVDIEIRSGITFIPWKQPE